MDRTSYKSNLEYREDIGARLASLANDLIDGRLGVVEATRRLCAFQGLEQQLDARIDVFIAIASETDALPVGEERALWRQDALARSDNEIAVAEQRWRERAISAAKELVRLIEQST